MYKVNNRIMQAFHHLFVYPKHFFIFKIIFVTIVTGWYQSITHSQSAFLHINPIGKCTYKMLAGRIRLIRCFI